jgi:hypothetical protein
MKHPAWVLYGGPIPKAIERASTIDRLTNHHEARQADPMRQARARTLARSRTRKVGKKRTPISRSWQFRRVGRLLAVHSGHPIYAQLTIASFTLRWPLAVRNRAEAEALVKRAVDARARIRDAARAWRECLANSQESKTALAAVLSQQRRFRTALLSAGAKRSKGLGRGCQSFG